MEKQKILQADYLDIVFDNRNKLYGGYDLRKNYADRVKRAAVLVLLSTGIICSLPVIAAGVLKRGGTTVTAPEIRGPIDPLVVVNIRKEQPKIMIPRTVTKEQPPAFVATVANPVLKIVPTHQVIHDVPPRADSVENRVSGLHDNPGSPDGLVADNGQTAGSRGTITGEPFNIKTPPGIATFVEQMPQFNGDINAFLENHLRYPEAARNAGIEGKVNIRFVVNEDGSIGQVTIIKGAERTLDAEAVRVVSSMPKWKPGRNNGTAVKVYFNLPILFQLQ